MEQEYYSSKHFTAEQIDQRLLQGTYDDAVDAGYKGTREEFNRQVATMVSSSGHSIGDQEVDNAYTQVINEAIRKVPQTLTESEKAQARTNIGAINQNDIRDGNFLNAGSITKSKIADDAVTGSKIKDGTIDFDKLSPATQKRIEFIEDGSGINDGSITKEKLSTNLQGKVDLIDELDSITNSHSETIGEHTTQIESIQEDKFPKSGIVQATGDGENVVMSQKAVSEVIEGANYVPRNSFIDGYYTDDSKHGITIDGISVVGTSYIMVDSNTVYHIIGNCKKYDIATYYYDLNKNYLYSKWFANVEEFMSPNDCRYIRIGLRSSDGLTADSVDANIAILSEEVSKFYIQDDLCTDDTKKALSARMGMTLNKNIQYLHRSNIMDYEDTSIIIPKYIEGYGITGSGSLFASESYGYFSPIMLKKGCVIVLNGGASMYLGQKTSILYQCDSSGKFIRPLILGDGSMGIAEYTAIDDIYVGISCLVYNLKYQIIDATTIKDYSLLLNKRLIDCVKRVDVLDGEEIEILILPDIGVRRKGYYINAGDGKQYPSEISIITNSIFLKKNTEIKAYTGGDGFGVISRTDTIADDASIYDIIAGANNLSEPVTYVVEEDGYYAFSGRNTDQGDASLSVTIMSKQYDGVVGDLRKKVSDLYEGPTTEKIYTEDELINSAGSLKDYYLHYTKDEIIGAANCVVTQPIYLYKGDKVVCSTGGTGLALFSKSPSSYIDTKTTGFVVISGLNTSFSQLVQEDGWYVFSGRINREDGTNLKVYVKSHVRGKSVYELLDEKADKSSVGTKDSTTTSGYAISVGADSVKDVIPSSPWFDSVANDGTTYGTYLDDKIDSIPDGDSFIFISDVHYKGNRKQSAKLIDYVRRRLGIKTIIHGGDVLNESPTIAEAAKEWLDFNRDYVFRIGGDFKQVCGDHDHNGRYASDGQALSYQFIQKAMNGYNIKELHYDRLYDEQVEEIANTNSWSEFEKKEYDAWKKMHYYFDDSTINTRFIVLHTGWTGDVGLAADKLGFDVLSENNALYLQMDFLNEALLTCPEGYNIVVVGHNVISNKRYTVNTTDGAVARYNVNELIWLGAWNSVTTMLAAFKKKVSVNLGYRDWTGEGLKSKTFDFSRASSSNLVICMGGDVHWDIIGKVGTDGILKPAEIATLDNVIPTEVNIKASEIAHILTMTDGGDRGYKVIVQPPSSSYNDDTDSVYASNPNTPNTLDAQAFDVVTITDDAIHLTRIGSGNDRIIHLSNGY